MKKRILIGVTVAVFMAAMLMLCYFFIFLDKKTENNNINVTETRNYNGNIVNSGIVAENNEYIFISSVSGKSNGIFRKSKENGEVIKICDDMAIYLNFYENELYYVNLNDNGTIYKIDDDGNDKKKVIDYKDCEYFTIADESAFFEYGENGNIYSPYRADYNFENVTKLNDDDTEGLIYDNGYLYYSNWSDGGKIYKMKTDGSEKTALNGSYSSFLTVYDDWVYYINDDDNYKICE